MNVLKKDCNFSWMFSRTFCVQYYQSPCFIQEIQQSLDVGHPLRAYLITPVQRITRYQLLLKEILKYTTRADKDSTCVQVISLMDC